MMSGKGGSSSNNIIIDNEGTSKASISLKYKNNTYGLVEIGE